ncbi:hypothetical protein [Pseudomonas mosselii]|uniref:hypothetical protein n=1 Tax=Pseudomonas mosselii TaxID=78327 RepID=UPI0021D8988B|nr:hypothetical protein [Pseudomonas mosselii]MCU9528367.1 hypothetical protein [Pseudomonas mosselii]MCU9535540.1 hypothetical protein [Pseudomonas mosselii]MCU9547391.1 hypothetical protein [Pseudomonas mosselii]
MKKALPFLALMALAFPSIAAAAAGETPVPNVAISLNVIEPGPGKEILVVPLTGIPFIANPVGTEVMLQGYVKKWGSLVEESGSFSKKEGDTVKQMEDCRCSIRLPVHKDGKGRLQPQDGLATIACMQPGGTVIVSDVPGTILGEDRMQGVLDGEAPKGFFVTHSTLHIPLE